MSSKTNADSSDSQDDKLPSRVQLAMLAAASGRKNASDAVQYALAVWDEAGRALAIRERAANRRGLEHIPMPRKFPATLDDFLALVVKARTPADATKRLRDFHRERLRSFPSLPVRPVGPYSSERRDEGAGPVDPEKWAANAIKGWKEVGFRDEREWMSLAQDYLAWWKRQKSIKAHASSEHRQKPQP